MKSMKLIRLAGYFTLAQSLIAGGAFAGTVAAYTHPSPQPWRSSGSVWALSQQ